MFGSGSRTGPGSINPEADPNPDPKHWLNLRNCYEQLNIEHSQLNIEHSQLNIVQSQFIGTFQMSLKINNYRSPDIRNIKQNTKI